MQDASISRLMQAVCAVREQRLPAQRHAGRVQSPAQYRWSLPSPCLGQSQQLDPEHDRYLALDRDPAARQYAHRELLKHQLLEAQLHDIRECLAYNFPLGNERFREAIETALGRRVGERKRGRPSAHNAATQI